MRVGGIWGNEAPGEIEDEVRVRAERKWERESQTERGRSRDKGC